MNRLDRPDWTGLAAILILTLNHALTASIKRYHTSGAVKDKHLLDQTMFCEGKLVFKVKACDLAVVRVMSTTSKDGILLSLGKDTTRIQVRDSTGRLLKTPAKKISLLQCDSLSPVWLHWDAAGVACGSGLLVGVHETLRQSQTVNIVSASVKIYTKSRVAGDWVIISDETPVFVRPPHTGSDHIDVPEDTNLGKVIYHVEAHDPDDKIVYDVIGDGDIFQIKGTGLFLMTPLDYETQKVHGLTIRARTEFQEVNATLIVNVTDVHDEAPVIQLAQNQIVVEELPVGQTIPGVFTVTEKERGGGLQYRLLGTHQKYVGIDAFTGELQVLQRLDYDDTSCPRVLDLLTLEVEDVVGHKARANLSIKVVNLNDNAPHFSEDIYKVKINEKDDIGAPLVTIRCEDPDKEDGDNITVTIVESNLTALLQIDKAGEELELSFHQDVGSFADLKDLGSRVNLTVKAIDSNTAIAHTATTQVQLDLSSVVDFQAEWLSPETETDTENETLVEIFTPEDQPSDLPITIFKVNWSDPDVIFTIQSVLIDSEPDTDGKEMFVVDESSGELRAQKPLDCDPDTGGVEHYTITVRAALETTPNKYTEITARLILEDVDDNAPMFSEEFYFVLSGCEKIKDTTLIDFNISDFDVTSNVSLSMDKDGSLYTRLDNSTNSLILNPSPNGTVQRWDTYEVVKITAFEKYDGRVNSSVIVVVYYENCSPGAQKRRRLRQKGVSFIPGPRKPCEVKTYVRDKTVEDYIFKATSGVLGLILICIAAFYLSKRTVFKSGSPSVNPLAEVQDEENEDADDTAARRAAAAAAVEAETRSRYETGARRERTANVHIAKHRTDLPPVAE